MLSQATLKRFDEGKNVLHGKVAIVTGSTYGIGFAIARRLAQDGACVLLCSRKRDNVDKAIEQLKAEGLNISAIQCHVGNKEDREKLVATAIEIYGKIDILVCNVAVNPFVGPILDTTEEMWEKVFHINVISTFFLIKLVAPHIQKQGGGSIIICSSFIGYIPHPYVGPYSITKTTLLGLTNIMAQALRFMNIRVNGLALGIINTNFSKVILKTPELSSKLIPLGVYRIGEPQECAGIASFLCSEDASYINGENIAVTGGMRGRL
ncbi:dehydrogenase/reductase SDR family member 4-like [Hyla sarda]|uniref:dehydrogenase/reductase SDR family member 4-like n=1 Tax=Hyla sarda TaxID=327740 RepID=UPI0024C46854|nr:dehydrogenase/reductase SDR family member 4-like [Hyla sarda]XP_056408259.1 dehydrogenase/reductase SDR family member 4-like [Hyla sarda]